MDLLDEASSRLKLQHQSKPEVIDQIDHEILTLSIENEALKKETDKASIQRRDVVQLKIAAKKHESAELTRRWLAARKKVEERNALRARLDQCRVDLERAKREANFALLVTTYCSSFERVCQLSSCCLIITTWPGPGSCSTARSRIWRSSSLMTQTHLRHVCMC